MDTGTGGRVRRQWLVLTVLLTGSFAGQFDFFVVNVAAPDIGHQLGAGPVALELVVGGYAFCYAAGMITGGRLGDLVGHRRMLIGGLIAFGLTSLLCGLAQDPAQLVAARMLQGLAAAAMVPQVLALITATMTGPSRARAIGFYGVAGGLAAVAGQVLGGLLLAVDAFGLGWRIVFLITVPVGLIGALLAAYVLPAAPSSGKRRLDLRGALGIAVALGLLLVPLVVSGGHAIPLWLWALPVLALPIAAATLRWQRVLVARGGEPVVDLSLLRVPGYVRGLVACAAFGAYFAGFMFVLTLFLQGGLGLTPVQAGLAYVPMAIAFAATSPLGSRTVPAGCALVCVGLLSMMWLAGNGLWVIVALAVIGAGNGMVLPKLIGRALTEVPAIRAGVGAAVLTTTQQFAGAAGVASLGALYFTSSGGSTAALRNTAIADLVLMLAVLAVSVRGRVSAPAPADAGQQREQAAPGR